MTRQFAQLISIGCMVLLFSVPTAGLYLLINIEAFTEIAKGSLHLPIHWDTVSSWQWYSLWLLTLGYVVTGLAGLFFLRRAFSKFAKGELFDYSNSRDIRLFSSFLFAQALAKPLLFSLASILLSLNHPSGQKLLSVSLGSGEIKVIALAAILWVMSDLLVRASALEQENKQFI